MVKVRCRSGCPHPSFLPSTADCHSNTDANAQRVHDRGKRALFTFIGDSAQRGGSISGSIFAESCRLVAKGVCTIARDVMDTLNLIVNISSIR
jgi:hypothetical protein